MRFNLNQKKNKKMWLHRALNPEPAAYDSSALTATLGTAVAKLRKSVIFMQKA